MITFSSSYTILSHPLPTCCNPVLNNCQNLLWGVLIYPMYHAHGTRGGTWDRGLISGTVSDILRLFWRFRDSWSLDFKPAFFKVTTSTTLEHYCCTSNCKPVNIKISRVRSDAAWSENIPLKWETCTSSDLVQ